MHIDDDGRFRVVVSREDPGTPNWIDTEARRRGLLVYRWVWAKDNPTPTSKVVPFDAVRVELPENHPVVDTRARRAALSRRRELVWNRFL